MASGFTCDRKRALLGKVSDELKTPPTVRWAALALTLAGGATFLMSSSVVGLDSGTACSDELAARSSSEMSKVTVLLEVRAMLVELGWSSSGGSASCGRCSVRGVAWEEMEAVHWCGSVSCVAVLLGRQRCDCGRFVF